MHRRTFIASVMAVVAAPFAWGKQQFTNAAYHRRNIEGNAFCTNLHLSNNFANDVPRQADRPFFYKHLEEGRVLKVAFELDGDEYAMGTILDNPESEHVWSNERLVEGLFGSGKRTALDLLKKKKLL